MKYLFLIEKGVYPKHDHLWEIEPASFIGGRIPEKSLPCFTFNITTQEIHCMLSRKEKNKIVDGADDRVMQNQYNFVLTRHQNPDIEVVGHLWEMTELQQVGALAQLV